MNNLINRIEEALIRNIEDKQSFQQIHIISCTPIEKYQYQITFSSKNFTLKSDILLIQNTKCYILEVSDIITCSTKKEIKCGKHEVKDYFDGNIKYLKALQKLKKECEKHGYLPCIDIEKFIENKNQNYLEDDLCLELEYINKNLNIPQKHAVSKAYNLQSFKLIGPPGTGKTTTILEIIMQMLPNKNILVCGPSNTSVDNILLPFAYKNIGCEILRIGDTHKCHPSLQKYNLHYKVESELNYLTKEIRDLKLTQSKTEKQAQKDRKNNKKAKEIRYNLNDANKDKKSKLCKYRNELINSSDIIFSTLYGCLKITDRIFDLVIVDECCQAQDVELLIAASRGKQIVLVGDPFQLGPVVDEKYHVDLYIKLLMSELMLDMQYRMPSNLINFSNLYFYENKIKSSADCTFKFFNESNLLFIDTIDDFYMEDDYNDSKYNIEEANLVKEIIDYIEKTYSFKEITTGIIMPYSAQVNKLNELLEKKDRNVSINTVDSFQGQERDIIIISLVRSNFNDEIGFMKEIRRMNVAITRCKKGLVIIGNSETFMKYEFFNKMIEHMYENAFCLNPNSLRILMSN